MYVEEQIVSVPTELRGKHKDCGGVVVFRPVTRKRELLAGDAVTLQSACRDCGSTIAVEYSLGAAPRTIWERPSDEIPVSSVNDLSASADALFVPRADATAHTQATRLEAPPRTVEVQSHEAELLLVAAGAADAWTAAAGSQHGGGSTGLRDGGGAQTLVGDSGAVVHMDAWRAAGRGGSRLEGRGAVLPGRSRRMDASDDGEHNGGQLGEEDASTVTTSHADAADSTIIDDARARALLGDMGDAMVYQDSPEPVIHTPSIDDLPISRTYASQFAHRFEAAREAVRRVKEELPSVLADDSRWAQPQLTQEVPHRAPEPTGVVPEPTVVVPEPTAVSPGGTMPDASQEPGPVHRDMAAHAAAVIAGTETTVVSPSSRSDIELPTSEWEASASSEPADAGALQLPELPKPASLAPTPDPEREELPPPVVAVELTPDSVDEPPYAPPHSGYHTHPAGNESNAQQMPEASQVYEVTGAPNAAHMHEIPGTPQSAPIHDAPQAQDVLAAMFDAAPVSYAAPSVPAAESLPMAPPPGTDAFPTMPPPASNVVPVMPSPAANVMPVMPPPSAGAMAMMPPPVAGPYPAMAPPVGAAPMMPPPTAPMHPLAALASVEISQTIDHVHEASAPDQLSVVAAGHADEMDDIPMAPARGFDWESSGSDERDRGGSGLRLKIMIAALVIAVMGVGYIVIARTSAPTQKLKIPSQTVGGVAPSGSAPTSPADGSAPASAAGTQPSAPTPSPSAGTSTDATSTKKLNKSTKTADTPASATAGSGANDPFSPTD